MSHSTYELISDCESFNEAIVTLKNLFEKPVNETYARHLLSTRRQLADESIDQYMQALKALAKPCNFKAVNAVDHQSEATHDTFIAGLSSTHTRQRLLESDTHTLLSAYTQARTLEAAQKNTESFSYGPSSLNAAISSTPDNNESSVHSPKGDCVLSAYSSSLSCFFCAGPQHPRNLCPAKDATCHNCDKKGHFAKACKSAKAKAKKGSSYINRGDNTDRLPPLKGFHQGNHQRLQLLRSHRLWQLG